MELKNTSINEKFVQEVWKNQKFEKNLCTKNGQNIAIIDPGVENKELGGPDFKNAKIKIGNFIFTGDIEIDTHYSDWKSHGHYLNKKYNSVVLHLTLNGQNDHPFVFTEDGRKIQSLPLCDFLDEGLRTEIQKAILSERTQRQHKMSCIDVNKIVEEKEKLDFLFELGMERYKHKCDKILERVKEIVYEKELKTKEPSVQYDLDENFHNRSFTAKDFSDHEIWEQILYELIFEALGYSKNKDQMLKLARSVDFSLLKQFRQKADFTRYLEAIYFTAAGLVPSKFDYPDDETTEYVRKLRETWNEVKPMFDNQTMNSTIWHFHKLRPQNFPTLRIAGGLRIVERMINDNIIGRVISDFKHIYDIKNLTSALKTLFITRGDGYWRTHYTFGDRIETDVNYFVGVSRVDELMVNVIFPVFSVYFEMFGKKDIAKKVQRLYLNYLQVSDNTLVSEMAEGLELHEAWKRSVLYQGMIELFRSYCSRNRCQECKIGKLAFN